MNRQDAKIAKDAKVVGQEVKMMNADDWSFGDPPNLATITVRQIVREGKPILLVSHDADDGGWQFLTEGSIDVSDAMIVGLGRMLGHDPTIAELADLPLGWKAWREQAGGSWQRAPSSSETA